LLRQFGLFAEQAGEEAEQPRAVRRVAAQNVVQDISVDVRELSKRRLTASKRGTGKAAKRRVYG
jgi:hypothetical protein